MVRQHLGMVFGPPERVEPSGWPAVLLGAIGPRDLAIGHVTDQNVPERVFRLVPEGRAPLATNEFLSLQRVQSLVGRVTGAERAQGLGPERSPDHRGILEQPFLLR